MLDFTFHNYKIPPARLKEIKAALEKEHGRDFSDDEVDKVAKFLYDMAHMALDIATKEAEWNYKLKDFPKGYAFELKGYSCRLCHGGSDAGMWYDKYGLKCMHCQKAVESGLIPGEITEDNECFYTDFDLKHYFNVGGKALTEWLRRGIIKARIISHYDSHRIKHLRLFLIADNYGFLPQKEMLRFSDTVIEEVDGKEYERHLKWYQCCDPFEYLKEYKIMNYLRRTDAENPPAEQEVKRKAPQQQLCNPTAFPHSFVNKRYPTKRRAGRKKKE